VSECVKVTRSSDLMNTVCTVSLLLLIIFAISQVPLPEYELGHDTMLYTLSVIP
jgi:hypothetical protein